MKKEPELPFLERLARNWIFGGAILCIMFACLSFLYSGFYFFFLDENGFHHLQYVILVITIPLSVGLFLEFVCVHKNL